MAINGVTKSANMGLLSRTLSGMEAPKKAAEQQQPVKQPPKADKVSLMSQQVPTTIEQVPTQQKKADAEAKAPPTVGLNIKA
jgi:hypothetical protein